MITAEEVTKAVQKMANNKAPGEDNINVELIKYAPKEIHKEISNILNGIFKSNDDEINLAPVYCYPSQNQKRPKDQ